MNKTLWIYVIEDIGEKTQYIPIVILFGFCIFAIWSFFFSKTSKKRKSLWHNFIVLLWLCYIVMLLYLTIFEREAGTRQAVSLKLFETFGNARSNAYVVENVLLFIPFGFFSAYFRKAMRNPIINLCIGALCSLMIEVIQLITQRGYFQVDDILMNSIGSALGCLCCLVILTIRHIFLGIFKRKTA